MKITRSGAVPSRPGPESYFTGTVRMDMEFNTEAPARVGGVTVTFEPGARTAWHTHPLGQTLIVTTGLGWARIEGEEKQEIRPGDIIWFPVNVIGNIYVSNGMSAGNTANEARVQALSEVFERYVKNRIIAEGICLPEVPREVIEVLIGGQGKQFGFNLAEGHEFGPWNMSLFIFRSLTHVDDQIFFFVMRMHVFCEFIFEAVSVISIEAAKTS